MQSLLVLYLCHLMHAGSIARRTSAGYLCMLIPSLTLTWLAAAYLVVVLMALAVRIAVHLYCQQLCCATDVLLTVAALLR